MGPTSRIRLHAQPMRVRPSERSLEELADSLLERRLRAAREEGFRAGERSSQERMGGSLDRALAQVQAELVRLETEASEFAVRFALRIATHLLRRTVASGQHDVEAIVRETLALSGVDRGNCVVHLSPPDHAALSGVPFRAGTVLEADPAVPRGDVHVTTPQGLFVRELDSILAALGDRLLEGDDA